MIGFALSTLKQNLLHVFDAQFRVWAGAAFMALALISIEYDEIIAPEMNRLSDAWGSVATDVGRKLASFTL